METEIELHQWPLFSVLLVFHFPALMFVALNFPFLSLVFLVYLRLVSNLWDQCFFLCMCMQESRNIPIV